MLKKKLFILISLLTLIYSCNTTSVKSTTYRNIYGDPQSLIFDNFIRSDFTAKDEKILFDNIADLTMNISDIKDFELLKSNPFSTNKSIHGIVVLSQYNLFFSLYDNGKNIYTNLQQVKINSIKKIVLEEFGLNNFSIMVSQSNQSNPSNNNVIEIINEDSFLIDDEKSHVFYNLLEKMM